MKKILNIIIISVLILSLSSCFWTKEEVNKEKLIEQINEEIKDEWTNSEEIKKVQEEMNKDVKDISQKLLNWEMTDKQAEEAMLESMNKSWAVSNMLEKQKKQMPKILEILKVNLKCLTKADSKSDAKKCEDKSNKLAKKYWIEEVYDDEDDEFNEDFEWNAEEKKEVIADITSWIKELEKMIPCIEKAKVMTDFMKCSQENMK